MSYFGKIYSDTELPPRARAVYMYLKDRANKNGECWPGIRRIARELGMSRSTAIRALNDLVAAGYVTKEHRKRDNGGNTSNMYTVK